MTARDEEKLANSEEITTEETRPEKEEKVEKVPPVTMQKYTRPPAFQASGNIGKWNLPLNNRQRPGRASGRKR